MSVFTGSVQLLFTGLFVIISCFDKFGNVIKSAVQDRTEHIERACADVIVFAESVKLSCTDFVFVDESVLRNILGFHSLP